MKPAIEIHEIEYMLFYLTDGDLSKEKGLLETEQSKVYKYFYLRKLQQLNQMIDHLESLKQAEKK